MAYAPSPVNDSDDVAGPVSASTFVTNDSLTLGREGTHDNAAAFRSGDDDDDDSGDDIAEV